MNSLPNNNHKTKGTGTMKYNHVLMATVLTVFICLTLQAQHQHKQETQIEKSLPAAKEVYSCPMHPEVVSDKPGKCPKCRMKLEKQVPKGEKSPATMTGKPAFEKSVDGVRLQLWLITQEDHKKMMQEHMNDRNGKSEMKEMDHGAMHGKGMMGMMHGKKQVNKDEKDHQMMGEGKNHDGKEMSMEMEAMMAGTHHVMVIATDETTKKAVDDADVRVAVTSPSTKSSIMELKSMMNHFGGGLNLDEKGEYTLDMWLSSKEKTRTVSFNYEVK